MHLPTGRARIFALFFPHFLFQLSAFPQRPPDQPDAAHILHEMEKLEVLGSVLYIAAHPDDENTRLIAWLANGKMVRTGYLSLTRGEGGQDLLGPELGDALGIIRTQELLEARRIDGGEQFFTRAVDFGFSKNAKECFEKWGHDEVLSDVVRVIRTFRPDIIITRFPPTREAGHGAHEASAILAAEAYDLAGDPKAFPEQLEQGLQVWQPRRLFFNGSTWWRKDLADIAKNDPDWYTVDVGGYDPLLGESYTEIAARSRSMHKSQGFGSAATLGPSIEYLHFEKGDKPQGDDIFAGIDMTWGRIGDHASLALDAEQLIDAFDPRRPERSLDALATFSQAIDGHRIELADLPWCSYMGHLADEIWQQCAGIMFHLVGGTPWVAQGGRTELHLEAIGRNAPDVLISGGDAGHPLARPGDVPFVVELGQGSLTDTPIDVPIPDIYDRPYWLARSHTDRYDIPDPGAIGRPELPPLLTYGLELGDKSAFEDPGSVPGKGHYFTVHAAYRFVDRVNGERIRPVYVTPVASVIPRTDIVIARGGPQTVTVDVQALSDSLTGQLNVDLPKGWATTKDLKLVHIDKREEKQTFTYQLVPMKDAQAGAVHFTFTGAKGNSDRTLHEIAYPHIMPQVYYTPAEVKLVPLDVKCTARTVGYVMGAGDDVPKAIEQLGVQVEMIDPATATVESLAKYDAIVTGIRAYNANPAMKDLNPMLMRYVENGGTLVSQYNTLSRDMVLPDSLFGPYPFHVTHDRVTVEEAPPTFLQRDNPLLKYPNVITATDFDGWVQERGLYFVREMDAHYTPLIAWNDPGEDPLKGALITCAYGKGRYVYTGISFFRELPAGVPGAFRLFANLISKPAP
ncbi:MAG: PIG-L family deacetylase [Flavobacteriales bacterium]|nr:PIG-L family deacetylase [Flavobacteriales bacterium]MCB9192898.1 PIG-L family deacetylase [Flavobacteriales bacterium]